MYANQPVPKISSTQCICQTRARQPRLSADHHPGLLQRGRQGGPKHRCHTEGQAFHRTKPMQLAGSDMAEQLLLQGARYQGLRGEIWLLGELAIRLVLFVAVARHTLMQ